MHTEDRSIHFSMELLHAPAQYRVPALQKLYFDLTQTRASYDSTDFSAPPQFRFHSKRSANTQSLALFLPDRLVLIEEWADIPLSGFLDKVREIAPRVLQIIAQPCFLAQTVTLRSTFALTYFDDARVFLLDHACRQEGCIGPHFRRPIAVGGLRFVLPETPESRGVFHVIIESFRHDVKEVFVELKAIFGQQRIDRDDIEQAAANALEARRFITDNIFPYLDQFDQPREAIS